MEANLPVWKYYEKGFVDPLYALYQRELVPGRIQSTGRDSGSQDQPFYYFPLTRFIVTLC